MIPGVMVLFVILAALFTLVHLVAIFASLYWWYWWLDILMHFWGGALIALGVHAFAAVHSFKYEPTTKVVFLSLLIAAIGWEVIERYVEFHDPISYAVDTAEDIILGLSGGLLAHFALQTYRMK